MDTQALTARQRAAATKRAASRRRILEAAIQQMAEPGGWDVRLDVVARRAQVSSTTLFKIFPTKGTLIWEVFDFQVLREIRMELEKICNDTRSTRVKLLWFTIYVAMMADAARNVFHAALAYQYLEPEVFTGRDFQFFLARSFTSLMPDLKITNLGNDSTLFLVNGFISTLLREVVLSRISQEELLDIITDFVSTINDTTESGPTLP